MMVEPQILAEKSAALEALLFIHGEPLSLKRISEILQIEIEQVEELIRILRDKLQAEDRGLSVIQDTQKVQLVTKPQFHGFLAGFVKEQLTEDLSPAALETLAIISYFGPISRAKIDYQRGVNSSFILRNLLLRGLVERQPDPTHPTSHLYHPSFELLRHLGLSQKEDLPDFLKYQELSVRLDGQEKSNESTPEMKPQNEPAN